GNTLPQTAKRSIRFPAPATETYHGSFISLQFIHALTYAFLVRTKVNKIMEVTNFLREKKHFCNTNEAIRTQPFPTFAS
ncbi:MAG: hypothetical protein Q4D36_01985, partial [Bacteroidales bacterium]|nr:hypothetical protein [Bacteroidales bacterium]